MRKALKHAASFMGDVAKIIAFGYAVALATAPNRDAAKQIQSELRRFNAVAVEYFEQKEPNRESEQCPADIEKKELGYSSPTKK